MDAFTDTLHLVVKPSVYARVWVLSLHVVAAWVCVGLAWYRPVLWPLLVLIGVSLCYGWRSANLRGPGNIIRLRWGADGRWLWVTRDGRRHIGHCVAAEVYGARLVVLTLCADDRRWQRRRYALFADALDAESHRRLRARLRVAPPVAKTANI
jgi:hypothetical protein